VRIPAVHLVWKKPRLFWSLFPAPLVSTIAACVIDSLHWWYYVASLLCAFFVLLSEIESLASGRIEDNWGRIEKKDHPIRYWLQIGIWLATWLCAMAFPLTFALLQGQP
jgi:hypothetical protein